MTNLEWLNELVPEVSSGIKTSILSVRGLTSTGGYAGGQSIELAEADLYMRLAIMPEVQEGSLKIKYTISSLKEAANRIYKKYGDARYDDGQPLIKGIRL